MSEDVKKEVMEEAEKGTTMNVYTALSKRKIYMKQLETILGGPIKVSAAVRKMSDKIDGKTREEAINEMKAAYDRPTALIKNLTAINSAIAISNATTKVMVAGKEYTVEELIFRMIHIGSEVNLCNSIIRNLNDAKMTAERNNQKMLSEEAISDHIAKLLPTLVAEDASTEEKDAQSQRIRENYIRSTEMEVVDPYGLLGKVESMVCELTEFKEEVNNALNLSNIQTMITVNLEG